MAQICGRLDGIPLALELAAARVGTLGVSEVSERLGDSLRLLTTGGRTTAPRQRTLRGTLDWSHDLLSRDEQRLFRRLSAFAGGWSIEAAEAVCSGDGIDERDVIESLSGLADKSLILAEQEGAAFRYKILEPVRQYGRERLEQSGEAQRVRNRHLHFFLALAEEAEPKPRGAQQRSWLKRLATEHDNFRVALARALEGESADLSLQLATALGWYWSIRGHFSEGVRWLERALALGAASPAERARAILALGRTLRQQTP